MFNNWHKFFSNIIEMLTSGWGIFVLFLSTLFQTLFAIEGFKVSLIALGCFYALDFITGCIASWKESSDKKKTWSFFESRKFRESITKATTYFIFITMGWFLSYQFFDLSIPIPFSSKGVNIIQIFFGITIAIECWSVLENMKRLGFDLIDKANKTFKSIWATKKQITNENND